VDGSPQIFFEDLFDLSTTTRLSHVPTSTANLPVRDYLMNLIWCHQKLNFKTGAYLVRWQAQDALVIERSAKALIGVNDSWSTWQQVTVQTNFGANVQLHDYSGANSNDIWTNGSGQATLWIPPCDGSNIRRGYCVWGPAGISGGFAPSQKVTTQEWEMANDLGDKHASSLKQGGALPVNSQALRVVGRIFAESGKLITLNLYQSASPKKNVAIVLYNAAGTSILKTVTGSADLTLTYTPASTNYYTIKVRNNSSTNPAQNVWVKANYTAPKVVATASFPKVDEGGEVEESAEPVIPVKSELMQNYPNPFNPSTTIHYALATNSEVSLKIFDILGKEIETLVSGEKPAGVYDVSWNAKNLPSGIYFYTIRAGEFSETKKLTLVK
jgi:alpha-amylase